MCFDGTDVKKLPVRYLGVPLISTRLEVRDHECIKQKNLNRISKLD